MNPEKNIKDKLNLPMLFSSGISLFFVIFLWGFGENDIFALGFNLAVFLLFLLIYLGFNNEKFLNKKNLLWSIPIIFISISFAVFENPFIKAVNILVWPIMVLIFYNYSQLEDSKNKFLNLDFFVSLIKRIFQFLGKVGTAIETYTHILTDSENKKRALIKRIIAGIILFLLIAFIVIIPLLSSADKIFAQKIDFIYVWVKNLVSMTFLAKAVVFSILSIFFLALGMAWQKVFTYNEQISESKTDPIIAGIVIGGVLMLYILFLAIQFRYLWIKELPIDFRAVEDLVKSGFWQLLVLSIINIGIFFAAFRKTNSFVQKILSVFTAASFLLLLSAAYRMGMYVLYYGFSYEKFYASYAVIFCAILFIWLFIKLFSSKRADILKFIVFLFLWMYGIIALFPLEQFVARTNAALSKRPDSRINLYELSMLSPDVMGYVKAHKDTDLAYDWEKEEIDWDLWIKEREDMIKRKKWYEKNLSNLMQ
ncbi:MAG: DUF4173 domain-containing protein [bacterium]